MKKLHLKSRWKSKSPKWAKILGWIALIITVAGYAMENAYAGLPEAVQSIVPEWAGAIVGTLSLLSRIALQFTSINKIFSESDGVFKKRKCKNGVCKVN